jgi:hypothetical protein
MDVEKQYASLDSATYILDTLAGFLEGKDARVALPLPEKVIRWVGLPLLRALNQLPVNMRSRLAAWAGTSEAIKPEQVAEIDTEEVAADIVTRYPGEQRYPVIALGSANGGLAYAFAALRIPWLPQTFLSLVEREIDEDNLVQDFDFGRQWGPSFLDRNPGAALYQMHDPSNDRLMAQRMAYFRWKYTRLPAAYQSFLRDRLEPGGTILIVECDDYWPVAQASDRQFYQVGGYGAVRWEEYHQGGERVREFLRRYGSEHEKFIVPTADARAPEAEWGFDERLRPDIERFAAENASQTMRLIFTDGDRLSVKMADFYRQWYKQCDMPTDQLFIGMFTQMDHMWVMRTGTIPLWLTFNGENSLETAKSFVNEREFRKVYLSLFSNTVRSIGVPPAEAWVDALSGEGRDLHLAGVDPDAFPVDLPALIKFYTDLHDMEPFRFAVPEPPPFDDFVAFIRQHGGEDVRIEGGEA